MDFRFKSVKSSFFEEENLRKKVKKKDCSFFLKRPFSVKRTALLRIFFDSFAEGGRLHKKYIKIVSLSRTENTQNTNTRS